MSLASILTKINKLTAWQVAIIIAVIGFAISFTGLTNPFMNDDLMQIVNNVPVHSIANIRLLFEGGTFYTGHGLAPLSGVYYRPLMMTVFSLLYTIFGPHALYFHLFQLLLYIGSAIILYGFFRYSFKPALSLALSLIYLVHPLNSQVIFAIPSMEDALFFFFGILALWLLQRFSSVRSLFLVSASLLLSLFAKETGVIFIGMALLYLFWWDRKRLLAFTGVMVIPTVVWLSLRIHAVGLVSNPNIINANAPIDSVSLGGRLLTAPSIVLFYITKFLFPWRLSTGYYWVYTTFSVQQVLLPLVIDIAVLSLVIYMAFVVYKKASEYQFLTYVFFAIWACIGLLPVLQIIPLDFTASEPWFYFSMAGVLGMVGVVLTVLKPRVDPRWVIIMTVLLIGLLGFRTAMRGLDWSNLDTLAMLDIAASEENYNALTIVIAHYISQGNYKAAEPYAEYSTQHYPRNTNFVQLGTILSNLGDYHGSALAYYTSMTYGHGDYKYIYENIAALTLVYGNPVIDKEYLLQSLNKFPNDTSLWVALALFDAEHADSSNAKAALIQAEKYGQVPQLVLNAIAGNQPTTIKINNINDSVIIR